MPPTPSGRRRPRSRAPETAQPPRSPARRSHPFRPILLIGLALVVGVVVVAAATGTADDLPWGAIIGVLVVMALAYVAGRRRIPPSEDD